MKNDNGSLLSKIAWYFTHRYRVTVLFWVILLIFGALSYTTFLKREGFPPINIPLVAMQGSYFADDSGKVDKDVVQPLAQILNGVDEVKEYQTSAADNSFTVLISLQDDVTPKDGVSVIKNAINNNASLPSSVSPDVFSIEPSKFNNRYNLILSVYSQNDVSYSELESKAEAIASLLENNLDIESSTIIPLYESATSSDGTVTDRQTGINKLGIKDGNQTKFYNSINIGVVKPDNVDDIELSNAVSSVISDIQGNDEFSGFNAKITSDFASTIDRQISSLQNNLIGGLVAVLIISLLLISWRAALVIALFIPTVMAISFIGLNVLGYTLNTITLFALILTLGLFVDDATIIVEAIDAHRKDKQKRKAAIITAVSRVGMASLAGTLTTIIVFTPMLYVSGVLGEFIRLMPVTVILALSVSFVVSLVLVPFLSRPLVLGLRSKRFKFLDRLNILDPAIGKAGNKLAELPLMGKKPSKKSRWTAVSAVGFSILAVVGAFFFAGKLNFDIFPQSRDSDELQIGVTFDQNTSIVNAQQITDQIDNVISTTISDNLDYVSYSTANNRSATIEISLVPYGDREKTSHDLIADLKPELENIQGASIKVSQLDQGPPTEDYPFQMRIYNNNVQTLESSSASVSEFLGTVSVSVEGQGDIKVKDIKIDGLNNVTRSDKGRFVTVSAAYDSDSVPSSVVLDTRTLITDEYDSTKLENLGLNKDSFDLEVSQQSENAESFSSIGIGLLIALIMMYALLVVLFNSFSQPILIFLAIPFSLFGVFFGLWATGNSLSFFVMVGLLGLIGIVVNNSILLTEYANQERKAGNDKYTAISNAVRDRFRPLVTTTLTTVFALVPLSISDPFWQPLAYTLIFGMISSTIVIIVSFPYYYLLFEAVRDKLASLGKKITPQD